MTDVTDEDQAQCLIMDLCATMNHYTPSIPCVLWGDELQFQWGLSPALRSPGPQTIELVVPDERLADTQSVLAAMVRLAPCMQPQTCKTLSQTSTRDRCTPGPKFHFHEAKTLASVEIHAQSDTLWFTHTLARAVAQPWQSSIPRAFDVNLLSRHEALRDPSRQRPYLHNPDVYHVVVPQYHTMVEALMRIHARDASKRVREGVDVFVGDSALSRLRLLIMDNAHVEHFAFDLTELPEPFRAVFRELRDGTKTQRELTRMLTSALGLPYEEEQAGGWTMMS